MILAIQNSLFCCFDRLIQFWNNSTIACIKMHNFFKLTHTHSSCVLLVVPQRAPARPVVQTEGTYCLKCCMNWSSACYCSCCSTQTDSDCQSHLASQSPPAGGCRLSGMRSTRSPAYLNTHTKRSVIISSRSLVNLIGAKKKTALRNHKNERDLRYISFRPQTNWTGYLKDYGFHFSHSS